MSGQNWRFSGEAGTSAADYFGHQKKQADIEARRPVIRRASDLVGPGIAASSVRITNWNDVLATFDGFFSSAPGASSAPNATDGFAGFTVSDSELGGTQSATSLKTATEYTRVFVRNPADPATLGFSDWVPTTAASSIFRWNQWPQSLAAATWTAFAPASGQVPAVRGSRIAAVSGNLGAIQVLADGWYEMGAQASFDAAPARAIVRVCIGNNPDANIQALSDAPSAGASYQGLNCSAVNYLAAGSILRVFLWSSVATGTAEKFFYVREA